ncbi:hypothetical protein SE1039_00540 [Staphylococcus equorum]|nr:hypothetical protein SE1039_00540 [Staphylococcus equorum]
MIENKFNYVMDYKTYNDNNKNKQFYFILHISGSINNAKYE